MDALKFYKLKTDAERVRFLMLEVQDNERNIQYLRELVSEHEQSKPKRFYNWRETVRKGVEITLLIAGVMYCISLLKSW